MSNEPSFFIGTILIILLGNIKLGKRIIQLFFEQSSHPDLGLN